MIRLLLKVVLLVVLAAGAYLWWQSRSGPGEDRNRPAHGRSEGGDPGGGDQRSHQDYISSVAVWQEPEGRVYSVRPNRYGRLADNDELAIAWRQAVRQGVPDVPSLRDQFMCHPLSLVARAKPTWDLEDWRPDIGLTQVMLAACNPD